MQEPGEVEYSHFQSNKEQDLLAGAWQDFTRQFQRHFKQVSRFMESH